MSDARQTNTSASRRVAARIALPAQDEDVAALRRAVIAKLTYVVGKDPVVATERDWFVATAMSARDRIVDRWMMSTRATYEKNRKRVYYLSLEFLIGRLLIDSLNNMQMLEPMRAALAELGVDLDRLREVEPDAALGNGGLGRLAACFMELVPPGDPRRLAARISRNLAVTGQSVGIRTAGSQSPCRLRRHRAARERA
jgi:starch phosphorylase